MDRHDVTPVLTQVSVGSALYVQGCTWSTLCCNERAVNDLNYTNNRNLLGAFHNHIGDKSDFNTTKQINLFVNSSHMGSFRASYRPVLQYILM